MTDGTSGSPGGEYRGSKRSDTRKRPLKVTVVFKDGQTYHPRCELHQGTTARDLLLVFWWPDFGIYIHGIAGVMDVNDGKSVSSVIGTMGIMKGKGKGKRMAGELDDLVEERPAKKRKVMKEVRFALDDEKGDAFPPGRPAREFPLRLSFLKDEDDVFELLDVMLERLGKGPDTPVELRYDVGFIEDGWKIRRVVKEGLEALKPTG